MLKVLKYYREVQRIADQADGNDDDGVIKVSISDVQITFVNAKSDAEHRAEKLVDAFCNGQRKYFEYYIKAKSDQSV